MNTETPVPFVAHVGIRHTQAAAEFACAEATLEPHMLNRSGSAHGGLIATLLDTTMSRAASQACAGEGRVVTTELKVTFIKSGHGTLQCKAWLVNRQNFQLFLEGEVHDAAGLLIARGQATFRQRSGVDLS